jgi:hypothetical protein
MDKVWLDAYHLTGAAQQRSMLRHDEPTLHWPRFKTLCQQRFGPPLRSNMLGEVARLPFRFTVEDYQDRLMALLCHAEPVPPPHQQVQLSIAGPPGRLRMDVELCAPGDLQQAMALARPYERRAQSSDRRPLLSTRLLVVPSPTSVGPVATTFAPTTLTSKRLTPAEMAERRCQGLCNKCDELFVRGHHCQRLFYLEVSANDDRVAAGLLWKIPHPCNPTF